MKNKFVIVILFVAAVIASPALSDENQKAILKNFEKVGRDCGVEVRFEERQFFDRQLGCEVQDPSTNTTYTSRRGGNFLIDLVFLREEICQAGNLKQIPEKLEATCFQAEGDQWTRSDLHQALKEAYEFLRDHSVKESGQSELVIGVEKNKGKLQLYIKYLSASPTARESIDYRLSRDDSPFRLSTQIINGESFLVHNDTRIQFYLNTLRRSPSTMTSPPRTPTSSGFSGGSGKGGGYQGGGR